jgi:Helix-turn-helix domain
MSYAPSLLEILEKCNLLGGMRHVYLALYAYADAYGEPVSPSLAALAKKTVLSRSQVIRCLPKLAKLGYISIIRRHDPGAHAKNFYVLRYPWQDEQPQLKVGRITKLKVGRTRARVDPRKTQDNKIYREQVGTLPPDEQAPQVSAEVQNYPIRPDKVVWLGLTPGSDTFQASLAESKPAPLPIARSGSQAGFMFQQKHVQNLFKRYPQLFEEVVFPPAL